MYMPSLLDRPSTPPHNVPPDLGHHKHTNSSCSAISKQSNNPIKKSADDLNRHFSREDIQMASRHIKKMLSITSYQRNTNQNYMKYHLTPVRMAIVKKSEVKVAQSCPTLCDPMDYTVHGILQARILEWVVFPFSRGSSQPRDRTRSPTLQADSLPAEPQGKLERVWRKGKLLTLLVAM